MSILFLHTCCQAIGASEVCDCLQITIGQMKGEYAFKAFVCIILDNHFFAMHVCMCICVLACLLLLLFDCCLAIVVV